MHDREGAEQMEMIYNWILKLSFFAVLGSVILQMIPDHGFQKYVRFVLGLILAAMLVVPVLELFDKRAAFVMTLIMDAEAAAGRIIFSLFVL